jgi:hypothetical protein
MKLKSWVTVLVFIFFKGCGCGSLPVFAKKKFVIHVLEDCVTMHVQVNKNVLREWPGPGVLSYFIM